MNSQRKVFILDDDELIVETLSRLMKNEGFDVLSDTQTNAVIEKITSYCPDIVFLDITLPGRNGIDILKELKANKTNAQVIMLTADDTADTAVIAMKLGAADYITKPFDPEEIKIIVYSILEKEALKNEVGYLRNYFRKTCSEVFESDIIGDSSAIKELISKAEKMAQSRVASILITGESGTGKEIFARHIHRFMHRNESLESSPFIWMNCAAMPEPLLESELFGYDKGAFTDARSDKIGLFEMAEGGSILLDEIGDMQTNLQSKLLRVLEERTIRRLGGKTDIPINVTVIATTNRNLSEAVESQEFRRDLFFRLSTFYLHIAPLSERKEDIPVLAKHFLSFFTTKYNKKIIIGFSQDAEELMIAYKWPGNVRELKNIIERMVVLENTEFILPEHLPKWLTQVSAETISTSYENSESSKFNDGFILPETGVSLEEVEKKLILQALERAKYNKTIAAKLLNISYSTLRYRLEKMGIK